MPCTNSREMANKKCVEKKILRKKRKLNTGSGFSVQLNVNYWSFTLVRRSVIHNRQVEVRFIIGYCIINYGTIDKVQ